WRVIDVRTDFVNISGFTVQNCGNTTGDAGIYIQSNNNQISNNIVKDNNWVGIWIFGEYSDNIISDNIVLNSRIGIGVSLGSNNLISDNYIHDQVEGIRLASGSNNTISDNNIENHSYQGIFIFYSNFNLILNNNIMNNPTGIFIEEYDNNTNHNILYHNNFFQNNRNAYSDGTNFWDNGYPSGGNYWDDYTGIDANGDGIGDTHYNILGGSNQDNYPLMMPYNI
ncbi:MAG: right-handed parallel beta-helix repeat-containing protein, partial [Candidatus Thermoplasmatota archaeon]|nr:right-handed parallel beta-helix repeat-containing protein [Candidatus Thermoplasmatota archaeon]